MNDSRVPIGESKWWIAFLFAVVAMLLASAWHGCEVCEQTERAHVAAGEVRVDRTWIPRSVFVKGTP